MASGSEMLLEQVRRATSGEYSIDNELGRGGMAVVYMARDNALDRRVAIKVMLPDLVNVEGLSERFLIEARTAAHLDHPGIVTVYSVKERDSLLFIVMKYIAGRTLESILGDDRAVPVEVATTLIGQIAEALHFAHTEGVIHRDVKPSNVLVDLRGRPVITDFGIAKVTNATSITVTGSIIGTPAYMSPEQCRGLQATAASDQYALGVMAYELFARRLPFTGTLFELIHAHCDLPPEPLDKLRPEVDPRIHQAIMKMLAKNPRERFASMGEVAKVFNQELGAGLDATAVREVIAEMAKKSADTIPATVRKGAAATTPAVNSAAMASTPAPALVITPDDPAIEVGATITLRVSESSGASLAGVRIEWRSEDASVATVDQNGRVTGVAPGLAKVTASAGAALGRATVMVSAPAVDTLVVTPQNPDLGTDDELQFAVTALDARGAVLSTQDVVWVSGDVSVCAVSQQGRAIGVSPGRATVTARVGNVTGTATVRVRPHPVVRVVVTPGELNLECEETRKLSAATFGHLERALKDREIRWRSTAPTIVSVAADGTATGIIPGTAAIIAECEGKEGIASVTVRPQPIMAVRIQPARVQLELGRSLQLQGVAEDRRGRPVTDRGVEWHSDDDRVAIVDASGKVHGASLGRTTVRATANGATSAIEVVVIPRPATQIQIVAHEPSIAVGERLQLEAVVLDSDGATLAGQLVSWTTDKGIAKIDTNGVVEGVKQGSARITATTGQVRTTTKLHVVAAAARPTGMPSSGDSDATVVAPRRVVPPPPRDATPTSRESGSSGQGFVEPPMHTPRQTATPTETKSRAPLAIGTVLAIGVIAAGIWYAGRPAPDPDTANSTTGADTAQQVVQAPADTTGRQGEPISPAPITPQNSPQAAPLNAPQRGRGTASPGPTGGTGTGAVARGGAAGPIGQGVPPAPDTAGRTGGGSGRGTAAAVEPPVVQVQQPPAAIQTPAPTPASPPVTQPASTGLPAGAPSTSATLSTGNAPASSAAVPPAGGRAESAACRATSAGVTAALNGQISGDPAARLLSLYQPVDAADTRMKNTMASEIGKMSRLKANARAARLEDVGGACEWVSTVELAYVSFTGAPRNKNIDVRMAVGGSANAPRVEQIFRIKGF
jgi:uncharacterized protein YjdB